MTQRSARFVMFVVLGMGLAAGCRDEAPSAYARTGHADTSVFEDASEDVSDDVPADAPGEDAPDDVAEGDGGSGSDATGGADVPLVDAPVEGDASPCIEPDQPCPPPPDAGQDAAPDATAACPVGEERVGGVCVPVVEEPEVACEASEEELHGVCVPRVEEPPPPQQDLVYEGSWTITSRADVDFILPYTHITGDLIVEARGVSDVYLPHLRELGLELRLNTTDAGTRVVRLPRLQRAGGGMIVRGGLAALDLPALERLGGVLDVNGCPHLLQLVLPSLRSVSQWASVSYNPELRRVELPALTGISNGMDMAHNELLRTFDLRALRTLGGEVGIQHNPRLPQCLVDALREQVQAQGSGRSFSTQYNTHNNPDASCE